MSDLYRIANFISDESLEAAQALIHQGVLVPTVFDTAAGVGRPEISDTWYRLILQAISNRGGEQTRP